MHRSGKERHDLEHSVISPLRALVIGAGPAAFDMHLPVLGRLRDQGRIVLAHVCDLQAGRARAAREQFGFMEASGDARGALARPELDVAYVFGNAQLHFDCGLVALRAGKHLFVEKPIAPTYLQARELAYLARSNGLVAVGGHNRRFYESLRRVREAAGSASWHYASATFHKAEAGVPPPFGARTWLGANGVHALDALIYMMGGLPTYLSAVARPGSRPEPRTFTALMRWEDGRQALLACDHEAGARREEYVFHGVGETNTITDDALIISKASGSATLPVASLGDGIAAEHEEFLEAIAQGSAPRHAIEAIAPTLFVLELIEMGYTGAVELPGTTPPTPEAHRSQVRAREPQSSTIMVAQPANLQPALGRELAGCAVVPVEDVRASQLSRPDILAAILGRASGALEPELLAKLPNLAIVGIMGLSLAANAPESLLKRGIAVVNARDTYAESVAELALGLAILGRRAAFSSHELMRHGGWGTAARAPGLRGALYRAALRVRPGVARLGLEPQLRLLWQAAGLQPSGGWSARPALLRGATAGLIGWGASARAFATRLVDAGGRVLVWSEHATETELALAGAVAAPLAQVLAADIVSLHRGLTPATRHALGMAELRRLRPGALLINLARGALIDPDALEARLRCGDIFACLDTYEEEPLAPSHPLRTLQNVFLTSHLGGGSADMHAAAAAEVCGKVTAYLRGDPVESLSVRRLQTMS
jgi:phosphoglycerate dehydrogenase-like enzyme/predicted dehydrogenase